MVECLTQIIGLTSLLYIICSTGVKGSSTTILNRLSGIPPDYSGQEKLFGKTGQAQTVRALVADRPRHKDDPRTEPMQKSVSALWIVRRISADRLGPRSDRLGPRSDRPASGADRPVGKEPKNPKPLIYRGGPSALSGMEQRLGSGWWL